MPEEVKAPKCEAGAPKWMCTFADMMSLLLCFFVLILSFSVMDVKSFKRMSGSMKDAFGIQKQEVYMSSPMGEQIISQNFQTVPLHVQVQISDAIEEEVSGGLVEVEHDESGMTLRVKDNVAYESGKADIMPRFKTLLDKLGQVIKENNIHVAVGGHTDNVPVRNGSVYSSNWDLSSQRAVNVVEYWIEKYHIAADKLSAQGFADGVPLASNKTEEGRARNRRVEFKIRPKGPNITLNAIELIGPEPVTNSEVKQ